MKLHTSTTLLHTSGVMERTQAHIKMSPAAFKILSSTVYSDKIGAVLREIGCNAADAHVEMGTPDRPFDVKMPSTLDPSFAIKDYGPGLSHDDVMHNLQTYFYSTKTESNDVTGCLGLGSKSPYAYTDQFTVKSAHAGTLRTYFCAFDETGVPTTSLVSESPVSDDWPHGIEVSLPVTTSDQSEFRSKAQQYYRWFRVPPNIIGGEQIKPVEYQWAVGRFRRLKEGTAIYYHGISDPHLIMGNVAYRLNHREITRNHPEESWIAKLAQWIYLKDIVFEVPIGTVDITASRESVEYTPGTIAPIEELFGQEMNALADRIEEYVAAFPDLTTGTMNGLIDAITSGGDAEAIEQLKDLIADRLSPASKDRFEAVMSQQVEVSGWDTLCEKFQNEKKLPPHGTHYYWDGERRRTRVFAGVMPVNNATIVLVNDRPKRAFDRVMELMKQDRTKNVLVFGHKDTDGWKEIPPILEGNEIPVDFKFVSDLPKPAPRQKNAGAGKRRLKGRREIAVHDMDQPIYDPYNPPDRAIDDIPDDSRYFLVRYAGGWGKRWITFPRFGQTRSPRHLMNAYANLKTHGLPVPSYIAVVTDGQLKRLRLVEDHGFKPLDEWQTNVLEKDQRVIDFMAGTDLIKSVRLNRFGVWSITREVFFQHLDDKPTWPVIERALEGTEYLNEAKALVSEYRTAKRQADQAGDGSLSYASALDTLGYRQIPMYENQDFDKKLEALHDSYPRLGTLAPQVPFDSRAKLNFYLMVLAMAVSPSEPVVITA